MAEEINEEELTLLKHTKSLLKSTKFHVTSYVVTSSECGYAFHLTFCHSADKKCYSQIISGYVPAQYKFCRLLAETW